MTFLGVPGRLLAKRSWVCGRSKIAKVRGSRGRSKSAKVPSRPYPKDPRVEPYVLRVRVLPDDACGLFGENIELGKAARRV